MDCQTYFIIIIVIVLVAIIFLIPQKLDLSINKNDNKLSQELINEYLSKTNQIDNKLLQKFN